MTTNEQELWTIALPNGDTRKGTIDQLDEAFNAGAISASTPVLAPGATEWSTLGQLAGLEDAPQTVAVAVAAPPPAPAYTPTSLRPVASDVPFDLDDAAMLAPKRSKAGWVAGALVACGALGFGAYTATHGGVPWMQGPKAAAAAVAPTPTPAPTPTVAAAPPEPPKPEASEEAKPKLTDDQRKALLEADKKLEERIKSKKKQHAESAPARRAKPAYDPIGSSKGKGKCGCNKGDPMCSCL